MGRSACWVLLRVALAWSGGCPTGTPEGDDDDWFVERSEALVSVNKPGTVFVPSDHYPYAVETATPQLATDIAAGAGPRTAWTP